LSILPFLGSNLPQTKKAHPNGQASHWSISKPLAAFKLPTQHLCCGLDESSELRPNPLFIQV